MTVTVRPFGHRPTLRSAVLPGCAGGAAGRVRADDGLDLVVAGGRGGVVGLAPDVGVGGVPALGLPVVDEVVGRDRRPVGPHRLGVELVDDGLGAVLVTVALSSSWVFRTGWSLLFTMKAWGHTMFMISCSTNSAAAEVLMLNPARFSSSAMVAVPPEDEDAFVDAPLVAGVTATMDTHSAAGRHRGERRPLQITP